MSPYRWTAALALSASLQIAHAQDRLPEPRIDPQPPVAVAAPADPIAAALTEGRTLFEKKQYPQAYAAFMRAVEREPAHKDARYLAGLAAYWARQPHTALEHWNAVLDQARSGSAAEWEIERQRVTALSAMQEHDAAEVVIGRLKELRRDPRLTVAQNSRGFVREHLHFYGFRAGIWEAFDKGPDGFEAWTVTVVDLAPDEGKVTRRLRVVATDGRYVLEENTQEPPQALKQWDARPEYAEMRAVVHKLLLKTDLQAPAMVKSTENDAGAPPVAVTETKKAKPPTDSPVPPPPAKPATPASPAKPAAKAVNEKAVKRIMAAFEPLRTVRLDVTALARASVAEPARADELMNAFVTEYPNAAQQAQVLVEVIVKSKAEDVDAALERLAVLGPRESYAEVALLTALDAAGRPASARYLEEALSSADFMVRQTAMVLAARHGKPADLEPLFKEVAAADAASCAVLSGSMERLVGQVLGQPGNDAESWKRRAAAWWQKNATRLQRIPNAPAEGPYWMVRE